MINAVRMRCSTSSEPSVWRFESGLGKFHRFSSLLEEPLAIYQITAALRYVFHNTPDPQIIEAAVQFNDNAGNSWIIQRQNEEFKILLNGEVQTEANPESLLHMAFFEVDEILKTPGQEEITSPLVEFFEISTDQNSQLQFYPFPLEQTITSILNEKY